MSADMPGTTAASFLMRLLSVAVGAVLLLVSNALGAIAFSGNWVLDLRSSSSPDPILIVGSFLGRTPAWGAPYRFESTYIPTPDLLGVHIRGPGFRRTDLMSINNQPETKDDARLGRYTIRKWWSSHGTQLVSVVPLRTKDLHDAQLTIVRELADKGKTLILSGTLKITGESGTSALCRVWRKRRS